MKPWLGSNSIRKRLFIGVLITTTSALLISSLALALYDLRDYHVRTLEDLSTQAKILGLSNAPALQFNDEKFARDSLATLQARPQILAAAIYTANGTLFATYVNTQNTDEKFPTKPTIGEQKIANGYIVISQPISDHNETLGSIFIKSRYQFYERVWKYISIVLPVTLLALITAMLFSLWLQARVAKPILRITDLARRVKEQNDYSLRADKLATDEIGYLGEAFNALLAQVQQHSAALELSNNHLTVQMQEREIADKEVQRLNAELEQRVRDRTEELERANRELEAFSYSVSHDLRTPLRAIDGFSQALLEDYSDKLDTTGRDYLGRVRAGAQRMGALIDDMLKLARVSRAAMNNDDVNMSALAVDIASDLRNQNPDRQVDIKIAPDLHAIGDTHLLRIALENLLNNAWKYTGKREHATIEFGLRRHDGNLCFFVEDNGAGFDMAYADKLFGAFQRLHDAKDFAGTGVGLATVQRIVHRHGGHIWAEAAVDRGAIFYFTLPLIEENPR